MSTTNIYLHFWQLIIVDRLYGYKNNIKTVLATDLIQSIGKKLVFTTHFSFTKSLLYLKTIP